jgi:hypothetical protein
MPGLPAESFDYAVSVATDDVRATFELLAQSGFTFSGGDGPG